MPQPSISVIIPTRDRHQSLADVLDHLYSTGPGNLEVIAIDDGSKAPVQLAHPAQVIRFNTSRGHASARNAGVARSSGEILVFLDDDVFPQQQGWAHLLEPVLESKPTWIAPYLTDRLDARPKGDARAVPQPHLPSTMLVTQRHTFEALGGFDESLTRMVDFDLTYRANQAGHRLLLDSRALAEHRDRIHTFAEKVQRLHEWLRIFPYIWDKQHRPTKMLQEVGDAFYFPSAFPRKRSLQLIARTLQPDWAWNRFRRSLPVHEPGERVSRTLFAIGGARGALRGLRALPPDARSALHNYLKQPSSARQAPSPDSHNHRRSEH